MLKLPRNTVRRYLSSEGVPHNSALAQQAAEKRPDSALMRPEPTTSKYERRTTRSARWGLVNSWATDDRRASQCINAKAETLEERRAFREAFLQRRCVVLADGSTSGVAVQRNSESHCGSIHEATGFCCGPGLYESWQAKPGEWQRTFILVTNEANALIKSIHDRMPVILNEGGAEDWMNPNEIEPNRLRSLLGPAPEEMLAVTPASRSVNSVNNDGPELLEDRVPKIQQMRPL